MSTAVSLLTVEEFLQLPEELDVKAELIEGVVVEMGRGRLRHELGKAEFNKFLTGYALGNPIGVVLSETLFVLGDGNAFQPDVSFVRTERLAGQDPEKNFQGAPDLAVEVVSSETAAQLERKVRLYLRAGSRAVWVAYPEERGVRAFHADGIARWLEGDQVLEEPDLLPGFAVKVSQLFEGI